MAGQDVSILVYFCFGMLIRWEKKVDYWQFRVKLQQGRIHGSISCGRVGRSGKPTNKPDRATMRPGCVSACIGHVTYVRRDRWTNRRVKRLLVDHLFQCRISPWPKTAEKRVFCTGVTDGPTDAHWPMTQKVSIRFKMS